MNEEVKILINELDNEDWHYFMEDGVPYKILFMEDRDLLLNYIYNLQNRIDKAINKLEFYNSGEALWYVAIQEIIDILKEKGE